MTMKTKPNQTIENILKRTKKRGDCLIWQGALHPQKLPMCRWHGKMVLVARKLKEIADNEEYPRNVKIRNTCGDKLCVNTDHYIVARPGTPEWDTSPYLYSKEQRKEIWDDVFGSEMYYGKREAMRRKYKQKYPKMTAMTFYKILSEYNTK